MCSLVVMLYFISGFNRVHCFYAKGTMSRVVDLHHCVANFAGRRLTVLANTTLSPHTDLHGTFKFTKLVHRCLCFEGVAGVGDEPTHRAYETQTSTESPALYKHSVFKKQCAFRRNRTFVDGLKDHYSTIELWRLG